MPKKESRAQGRKRRAQFEVFLNESRKFMKKMFKRSGYAKRQSADIRRQDKSAGTDNHRIVKHRGRKMFVCPGAQDALATPLVMINVGGSGQGPHGKFYAVFKQLSR